MIGPPHRDDASSNLAPPKLASPQEGPRSNSAAAQVSGPLESLALDPAELDVALQLLVERAQYITGATGAALALPQGEEMVCRASTGSCAPAIGARLQVRSGLTGESIASRRLLRCDNAESDPRVNLEVCRALGIASIVVLPLLRQTEVCGLFELLSDHPYAFEERDLVALERMGDLALTALELADRRQDAARPQPPNAMPAWPTGPSASSGSDWSMASSQLHSSVPEGLQTPAQMPDRVPVLQTPLQPSMQMATPQALTSSPPNFERIVPSNGPLGFEERSASVVPAPIVAPTPPIAPISPSASVSHFVPLASAQAPAPALEPTAAPESTTLPISPEAVHLTQKCAACGFPISQGRVLCLDCEGKARPEPVRSEVARDRVADSHGAASQNVQSSDIPDRADDQTLGELSAHSAPILAPDEALPPFLANAQPFKESWISNNANLLLAIAVLLLGAFVVYVVLR